MRDLESNQTGMEAGATGRASLVIRPTLPQAQWSVFSDMYLDFAKFVAAVHDDSLHL